MKHTNTIASATSRATYGTMLFELWASGACIQITLSQTSRDEKGAERRRRLEDVGGRRTQVGTGRGGGGPDKNPTSALPTLPMRLHTVHVLCCALSAFIGVRSLTVLLSFCRSSADLSVPVPTEYRSYTVL